MSRAEARRHRERKQEKKENKMNSYHYGNPVKANTWEYAASIFAAHESVNSEKTSSLPLVQFWKPDVRFSIPGNEDRCADRFFRACKIEDIAFDLKQAEFSFEYPVPAQGGRGKASMTDLMITTNRFVMAIEAKWTECRENYKPTIEKWLQEGKNLENRRLVLNGWLDCINKFLPCSKRLDVDKIINRAKIPYQFLHRVASACYVASMKKDVMPVVAYQLFYDDGNNGTEKYMSKFAEELKEAYKVLFNGDDPVRFNIIKVKTEIDNDVMDTIRGALSERIDAFNDIFMIMQEEDVYRFLSVDPVFSV